MLTKLENDRLTQVTGDAVMGRLMRGQCWVPIAREAALEAGQPPRRVRLFGEDFVAFRGEDGRVGLVDERCPHRGVSLTLAQVEGCSLRCIYHGWRIDASGAVIEVPSEGARSADVAGRVPVNRYPVREAGGLIWAYLGEGEAPAFPNLPFMDAAPENRFIARTIVPCNWLQSLEGGLDSAHVGWLHQSWFKDDTSIDPAKIKVPPRFRTAETAYGLRAAAIRDLPDGGAYVRIAEFIQPFTILLRTDRPAGGGKEYSCFMMVPIDDEAHLLFWYIWSVGHPLQDIGFSDGEHDLDDYARLKGTREDYWGQDRAAIAAGHFSGFTDMLIQEDVAAQVSMGPIADRTKEHLCSTDVAVAQTRRTLLKMLRAYEEGQAIDACAAYEMEGTLPFASMVSAEESQQPFRTIKAQGREDAA